MGTLMLAGVLTLGVTSTAFAKDFGTDLNGASSNEYLEIRYEGAAWNYEGSGYKNASFKYTRNGKTLLAKTATSGKFTGGVWYDLRWGDKYTTYFSWNHQK